MQSDGAGQEDLRAAEGSYIYLYVWVHRGYASVYVSCPFYNMWVYMYLSR